MLRQPFDERRTDAAEASSGPFGHEPDEGVRDQGRGR
jgi:hypothetical protein